jgi:CheY-like chemotaxis protein
MTIPVGLDTLVVDDDAWVRASVRPLLEALGFKVEEAPDGPSALAAVSAQPSAWAFVLLDVRLPGMRCHEVLDRLFAVRQDLPVLLHTGFDRSDLPAGLFGRGRVGFLAKPAMLDDIATALRQLGVPLPAVAET